MKRTIKEALILFCCSMLFSLALRAESGLKTRESLLPVEIESKKKTFTSVLFSFPYWKNTKGNVFTDSTVINFAELSAKTYADESFELVASSNHSTSPIYFVSSDPSTVSVSNSSGTWKAFIHKIGDVTISAVQDDSPEYTGGSVQRTLSVAWAQRQSIINYPLLPNLTEGEEVQDFPLFPIFPNSTSEGALSSNNAETSIVLTSSDPTIGAVRKVSSGVWYITVKKAGTITITANQPGNDNYLAAAPVSRTLVIKPGIKPVAIAEVSPVVEAGIDYLPWYSGNEVILPASGPDDSNNKYVDIKVKLAQKVRLSRIQLSNLRGSISYPISIYALDGTKKILLDNFNGTAVKTGTYYLPVDSSIVADALIIHKYGNYLPHGIFVYGYLLPSVPVVAIKSEIRLDVQPEIYLGDADFTIYPRRNNNETPITLISSDSTIVSLRNSTGGSLLGNGATGWIGSALREGIVTITANQPGNEKYAPAVDVVKVITVNPPDSRQESVITFSSSDDPLSGFEYKLSRDSTFTFLVTSSNKQTPIHLKPTDTSIIELTQTDSIWKAKILKNGEVRIIASQAGNENYKPAQEKELPLWLNLSDMWGERLAIASITPSEQTGMDYFNWWNDDLNMLVQNTVGQNDPNQAWVDITLALTQRSKISKVSLYDIVGEFPQYPVDVYALNGTQKTLLGTWKGELKDKFFDIPVDTSIIAHAIVIHKFGNQIPQKVQVYGFKLPDEPVSVISTELRLTVPDTIYLGVAPSINITSNRPGNISWTTSNSNVIRLVSGRRGSSWQVFTEGQALISATQNSTSMYSGATVSRLITVVPKPEVNGPAEERIRLASISTANGSSEDYFSWWFDDVDVLLEDIEDSGQGYSDVILKLTKRSKISRVALYDGLGEFPDHPVSIYALNGIQRTLLGTFTGALNNAFVDIKVDTSIVADAIIVNKFGNHVPQKVQVYGFPIPDAEFHKISSVFKKDLFKPLPDMYVNDGRWIYLSSANTINNNKVSLKFTSSDTSVVFIENGSHKVGMNDWFATGLKPGTATITVSQAGNDEYLPAQDVVRTLTILMPPLKGTPTISFPTLAPKPAGTVINLNITSTNGQSPVLVSSSNDSVATVALDAGSWKATLVREGSVTFRASQAEDENFYAAPEVVRTLTVTPCVNPVSPAISSLGSTQLCAGESVTLSTNATTGVQWYKDGLAIVDATNSTFSAREAGVYIVSVANACGTAMSDTLSVSIRPVLGLPFNFHVLQDSGTSESTVSTIYSWTGTEDSVFSNAANWMNITLGQVGQVPPNDGTAEIIIPSGLSRYPVMIRDYSIKSLAIDEGASLDLDGYELSVKGDISNNKGEIRFNDKRVSSISFNGRGVQSYIASGETAIANWGSLKVNKPDGGQVNLRAPVNVFGAINISRGILNSDGNLTLKASYNNTDNASVGPLLGGAAIFGDVNVEYYYVGKARGTRSVSSPINDASLQLKTFQQLKKYVIITGSGGAANGFDPGNTAAPYAVSVNGYNEPAPLSASQFIPLPDIYQSLPPGQGALFLYRGNRDDYSPETANTSKKLNTPYAVPEDQVVTYTGPLNQGDVSASLSFTFHAGEERNNGVNLVGNPYPSVLDWDLVRESNPSLIDYLHMIKPTGTAKKENGVITDPDSLKIPYIKPGEAMYVKTRITSGMTFKESFKVSLPGNPCGSSDFTISRSGTAGPSGIPYLISLKSDIEVCKRKNQTVNVTVVNGFDSHVISNIALDSISNSGTVFIPLSYLSSKSRVYVCGFAKPCENATTCGDSLETITVAATPPAGTTVEYKLGGGAWQASPVFDNMAPGFYKVYSRTVAHDCYSRELSIDVALKPTQISMPSKPIITAEKSVICEGDSIVLTAKGVGIVWSNGFSGNSITIKQGGTYSATASNSCGVSAASEPLTILSATRPAVPTISAQGTTELFNESTVTLTAIGEGIKWSNGAVGNTVIVSEEGGYTATASNECGESMSSDSIRVTRAYLPVAPVLIASRTDLCDQKPIIIKVINTNETIHWSTGEIADSILVTTPGKYSARTSNSHGMSASSDTITIVPNTEVLPVPVVSANYSSDSTQVFLTATGTNIRWSNGAIGNSLAVSEEDDYTARTFSECGVSEPSDTITVVTKEKAPLAPIVSAKGPTIICKGDSVVLTSTGIGVMWSNGAIGNTITVGEEGEYTAVASNDVGTSPGSNTIVISYRIAPSVPEITVIGSPALCPGSSVVLQATGSDVRWSNGRVGNTITVTTAGSYTATDWLGCASSEVSDTVVVSFTDTVSAPVITAVGPTVLTDSTSTVILHATGENIEWSNGETGNSITINREGEYTATASNYCGVSQVSNAIVVTTKVLPSVPVISTVGPAIICRGVGVTLYASTTGARVLWSNGAVGDRITVNSPGEYSAISSNETGSSAVSNIISVVLSTTPPAPVITADGSTELANGSMVTLNASGENIIWSNGKTGNSITVNREGSYTARASNECEISAASNLIEVSSNTVPPQPVLTMAAGDSILYVGSSVTLNAETTGLQVVWSTGQTGDQISVSSAGTYTATAYNKLGASVMSRTITIPPPQKGTPVAVDDNIAICEGSIAVINPLKNDYDITAGTGTLKILKNTNPSHGVLVRANDGTYMYKPKRGFTGEDTFTYVLYKQYGNVKYNSANDHYYEFIPVKGVALDWQEAKDAAARKNYSGLRGYLATITSARENSLVQSLLSGRAWLGGSDSEWENHFKWVTGPENGRYINGIYTNWAHREPNNDGRRRTGEDAMLMYTNGLWNDGTSTYKANDFGYVVEYGGPGFGTFIPPSFDTATVTIKVQPIPASATITADGPTGLCSGKYITLTASEGDSYLWSTKETTRSIKVNTPGIYTVIINPGACSRTSLPIRITSPAKPLSPTIIGGSATPLCAGQGTKLLAIKASILGRRNYFPIGVSNVKWYLDGVYLASGNSVDARLEGVYTATTISGCLESAPSNPITIKVDNSLKVKRSVFDTNIPSPLVIEDFDAERQKVINGAKAEIAGSCESQADNWMRSLASAQLSSSQQLLLRARFIEICTAGGTQENDSSHPMGATSLPAGKTINGLNNFGDAIKSVTGNAAFTADLNPWLISYPYPYEVQAQMVEKSLAATNADLCAALTRIRQDFGNPGDDALYTALKARYKDAMTLSLSELKMLTKACGNCKYLLETEIPFPVFLSPGNAGCITRSDYQQAINALFQVVPDLNSEHTNYETTLTNFLNQRWGFSLGFDVYSRFAELPLASPEILCSKPLFAQVAMDPYEEFKNQIAIAVANGKAQSTAYIAEKRKLFIEDYVNTCSKTQSYVKLEALQNNYHYTLYYYDQAENLVRTVPPEGVRLLSPEETRWTDAVRNYKESACIPDAGFPMVNSSKELVLEQLTNSLEGSNTAIEMWLYNPSAAFNQVLLTSREAVTQNRKYMMQACIDGKYLNIELFSLSHDQASNPQAVTFTNLSRASVDISKKPLAPWTHLVIQSADFDAGGMTVYIDGELSTLVADAPPAGCVWEIKGDANRVLQMDEKLSSLKYLRLYDKQLSMAEIKGNYTAGCFMLAGDAAIKQSLKQALGNRWFRFNAPVPGDETLASGSTTVETRIVPVYPAHSLTTSYAYNSTNQVIKQQTPDGGISKFWYDMLSRLVASQNQKQSNSTNPGFSYTQYDLLGRIVEVGEKAFPASVAIPSFMSQSHYLGSSQYHTLMESGVNSQLTQTIYDNVPEPGAGIPGDLGQKNLRKRVAASIYRPVQEADNINASYYDYDISGNVKTLWQQVDGLGLKKIEYAYDLVSGKVNEVHYQRAEADRFYYRYNYDSENRLVSVLNGTDEYNAKLVASYQYYPHGPLARVELGSAFNKVQGLDYAYTLQGWLKGVNGQALDPNTEIGKDGPSVSNSTRDVYAYSLGYYKGDYKPIGGGNATAFSMQYQPQPFNPSSPQRFTGLDLYNGNISNTTVAISKIGGDKPFGYTYRYDQLNRLKEMRQHPLVNGTTIWDAASMNPSDAYKESISYDANGNIQTFVRNGKEGNVLMDNLVYMYEADPVTGKKLSNKLRQVKDGVAAAAYAEDLDNQESEDNYQYDAIGNLTKDIKEGITAIDWTVYGKISSIAKAGSTINYTYDASGNRVSKTVTPTNGTGVITFYVRDAQGNTLGIYERDTNKQILWKEQTLYGSSRLGMFRPDADVSAGASDADIASKLWANYVGYQNYELGNHLGNVLAVISDKRILNSSGVYEADVVGASDYYAFGQSQPGRTFGSLGRYSFNGKEDDSETGFQDYGMRMYDRRTGRFISVDPITKQYPELTPYQFSSNNPIANIDVDGLEGQTAVEKAAQNFNGYRIVINLDNAQTVISRTEVTSQEKSPVGLENVTINYTTTSFKLDPKGKLISIQIEKYEAQVYKDGYHTGVNIDRKLLESKNVSSIKADPLVKAFAGYIKSNPNDIKEGTIPILRTLDDHIEHAFKKGASKVMQALFTAEVGPFAGKLAGFATDALNKVPDKDNNIYLKKIPLDEVDEAIDTINE